MGPYAKKIKIKKNSNLLSVSFLYSQGDSFDCLL